MRSRPHVTGLLQECTYSTLARACAATNAENTHLCTVNAVAHTKYCLELGACNKQMITITVLSDTNAQVCLQRFSMPAADVFTIEEMHAVLALTEPVTDTTQLLGKAAEQASVQYMLYSTSMIV